jgi:hypothetical protein
MEAAYANYLTLTELPDKPTTELMTIYLMSDRKEWIALSEYIFSSRQNTFHSISAGGYCYQGICVFWDIGNQATYSVSSHEGLHQFFYHRLKNPLPLWLEEGLCASAEGYIITGQSVVFTPQRNNGRLLSLRDSIIQDYWIPIEKLLPLEPAEILPMGTHRAVAYYAQLWSLAIFLRTDPQYQAGFKRLMADAEAGRFGEELNLPPPLAQARYRTPVYNRSLSKPLFEHYITQDFEKFEREYRAFSKKLADLNL